MAHIPEETPTSIVCPECDGKKLIVREEGTTIRASQCDCCTGTGIVTVSRLRAWKLAKALQP